MARTASSFTPPMPRPLRFASLIALAVAAFSEPASALNGFFASKQAGSVKSYTTQMVVMKKGNTTAISLMPDYEGPLEGFAIVLLVPSDVTVDGVNTLKREFIDRVDSISAPRFHEFWEQDPCDPSPPQQEWERSLKVEGAGFLGGGSTTGEKKVAKELFLDVKAKQKEGEYKFTVLDSNQDVAGWLTSKGYKPPEGAQAALKPYLDRGMKTLIAEVDAKRIELVGGDRAQLSPLRYYTQQPFDTIVAKPGLLDSPGKQELIIYVLDPEARYEAKNYPTLFPPTNINVDFAVKERMGEFYAALHDIILEKNPKSFLLEYAWPADSCGKPCPTEPLMVYELLSLGADVFEKGLPEDVRNPKPPELTKEEKEARKAELKELKPKERKEREKQLDDERTTVVVRKALVERNKYLLTRLHYRYDAATLPEDPTIGAASSGAEGGIALPQGPKMEINTDVKMTPASRFQTRYNNFHPWVPVIQCEHPERGKWGKSPPDYRGLRKTWIAEDLSRKSRTQIKPAKVVITPIPALGLPGVVAGKDKDLGDAGADAAVGAPKAESGKCGCSVPGAPSSRYGVFAALGFVAAWWSRRRRG
jgi:MYXO-CTERM domain-containing protein